MKKTIFLFIVFVIVALTGCGPTSNGISTKVEVGQTGYIDASSDKIPICETPEDYSEFRKTIDANDTHGLAQMMLAGKIVFIPKGTKVLVIDYKSYLSRVRILEGKYTGAAGWTPFERVINQVPTQAEPTTPESKPKEKNP
jgi:hypothetical protein